MQKINLPPCILIKTMKLTSFLILILNELLLYLYQRKRCCILILSYILDYKERNAYLVSREPRKFNDSAQGWHDSSHAYAWALSAFVHNGISYGLRFRM